MTYGTWQLAGTQYSTPQGGFTSLGPFAIAFGPVTQSQAVLLGSTTPVTVASVTTLNSQTVTSSAGFASVQVGMFVTGTGIPADTQVDAIASTSSLTITQAATASGSSTLTFTNFDSILVPPTSLGVCIIPPIGNTTPSLTFKTVLGDTGTRIAPGTPTLIAWDSAAVPGQIFLAASGAVTVQVQFT